MTQHVFKLPDLGEGTVSAEIVAWRVQPGDAVREDDPLVEMSTDKAVVEVPSPVSGRVLKLTGNPGDTIAVGADLVLLELAAGGTAARAPEPVHAVAEPLTHPKASPATRRKAREAGIDLGAVSGTGPGGRVLPADLERVLQQTGQVMPAPAADVAVAATSQRLADAADIRDEVPIVGIRRLIAQRLVEAVQTIPHFSYIESIDITELEALRNHLNSSATKDEPPLSYLPFLILAVIGAVDDYPQVNSRYDAARETLTRFRAVHVGIATQAPDALKVPVVRNAERRNLRELSAEIARLSEVVRSNRVRREELTGSTITISSLGKLGAVAVTPIINPPEVAIIGVNKATEMPVVRDGQIVIRRIMNLSCSFDHRFIDGVEAASFVQAMKRRLEMPALLFGALNPSVASVRVRKD